jgi:hypothetical protein
VQVEGLIARKGCGGHLKICLCVIVCEHLRECVCVYDSKGCGGHTKICLCVIMCEHLLECVCVCGGCFKYLPSVLNYNSNMFLTIITYHLFRLMVLLL